MPVNIKENERYKRLAKSLMQKNVSGEKQIKGMFAVLVKWRKPMPEEDRVALNRIFAIHSRMAERRTEIREEWTRILKNMPIPRYPN